MEQIGTTTALIVMLTALRSVRDDDNTPEDLHRLVRAAILVGETALAGVRPRTATEVYQDSLQAAFQDVEHLR